ncbi:GGDEF domain-containing protein [Acidovorax sp. RAC01]|uniref:GGDEF domain-containing protein n=1 Tax=Acidovorax sp. RAC01 TaxID=1842533 RepID=UPI00083E91EE|nr:GGDEF domain-containing protein [Acidovorax sp. RAC01]AOG25372.1 diguanylate cyclase domain protein [Acidovorax sp. RAC01]
MAFAAHVPTMLIMVIASFVMMAAAMAVVAWGRRHDGLLHWSVALLVNAVGHTLLLLRGQIPDVISIVGANGMLSGSLALLLAAIFQFQGRSARWMLLLLPPVMLVCLIAFLTDDFTERVALVGTVLGLQSLWVVAAIARYRRSTVGRGQWLVVAGLGAEAAVLLSRAFGAMAHTEAADSILDSSAVQTLTFLTTFSVVLVSSLGFIFMLRDRADENNRVMAARDPLTGVANRRSLVASLDRDVARALRTHESIAVMMVDIDHFKRVNDIYGHPVGDQVLCSVVNVLRERVRAQDLVGRYGGEEFMVVLPDTGLAGAEQLARALCRAVADSRCHVSAADVPGSSPGGVDIEVTVSIGVYGGQLEQGDSWDLLIAAADRALYQAKENGRNRVEVATSLRSPGGPAVSRRGAETLPTPLR